MSSHSGSPSFALISVLALVSLAALTATAFLAAARLDRVATRSIGSQTQLDMSLQAGAEMARFMIDSAFQDSFIPAIVTYFRSNPTNDLGYLLLGKPTNDPSTSPVIRFYPAFSHARVTNLSLDGSNRLSLTNVIVPHQGLYSSAVSGLMSNLTSSFGTLALASNYVRIPLISASGTTPNNQDWSPAVGWITLSAKAHPTNTTNTPYARVAFFVQDLSGLIDAERMGGITNRDSGTNPAEISLTNMLNTNKVAILTDPDKRRFFLSPRLLMGTNLTTNDLRYVASGLRSSSVWSSLIPYGVPISSTSGYALAGSKPLALNPLPSVATLVSHLRTNLPDFTNRAGGMNGTNYLNALAANIIDYADSDPSPTTTIAGGTAVAGFDSIPLPTIIFDRMTLAGSQLTVISYWQFWNCSTVTSPAVIYGYSYDFADTLGAYVDANKALQPVNARMTLGPWTNTVAVPSLSAGNSFITSFTNIINLPIPPSVISILINGTNNGQRTTNNRLTLFWSSNGSVISDMRTGYERRFKTISNNVGQDWSGGMPGLRYDNVAGSASFNVPPTGDPRMLSYLTNTSPDGYLSACDYDQNTEWGLGFGQTKREKFSGSPYSGSPANWVDSTNASGNQVPGNAYSDNTPPALGTNVAKVRSLAKLSSAGSFTNLTELGNIFDPVQWVSVTAIQKPSDWVDCDISAGTIWSPNSMYGGGQTLRIGRREHSRFAFTNFGGSGSVPSPAMGTAASSLLDIFCLTIGPADNGGKININTAPGPVLAALSGGITLQRDPNKSNNEINSTMVTAFTNGVMRFRALYPFITPSQLAFISGSYGNSGWTNSNVWSLNAVFSTNSTPTSAGGLNGVISLNDEGREEWFAKMFGLASVTSFNFRVYVVAQLLDASGRPTSSMERRMFHIYCNYNSQGQLSTKQVGEFLY